MLFCGFLFELFRFCHSGSPPPLVSLPCYEGADAHSLGTSTKPEGGKENGWRASLLEQMQLANLAEALTGRRARFSVRHQTSAVQDLRKACGLTVQAESAFMNGETILFPFHPCVLAVNRMSSGHMHPLPVIYSITICRGGQRYDSGTYRRGLPVKKPHNLLTIHHGPINRKTGFFRNEGGFPST